MSVPVDARLGASACTCVSSLVLRVMLGLVVLVAPLPEVPAELVLLRDQASAAMVLMLVL